jgi:hypothetical protein
MILDRGKATMDEPELPAQKEPAQRPVEMPVEKSVTGRPDNEEPVPAEPVYLLAYPARLTVTFRAGGATLRLATIIKDITHAGATLEIEAGHLHDLPQRLAEGRVSLEFTGPTGHKLALASQVKECGRPIGGQALAQIVFENIHLPEVEEIQALRASSGKDRRLLWELWDRMQEEGA